MHGSTPDTRGDGSEPEKPVVLADLTERMSPGRRLAVVASSLVAAGAVGATVAMFGHVAHGPGNEPEHEAAGEAGPRAHPDLAPRAPKAVPGHPQARKRDAVPAPRSRPSATRPLLAVLAEPGAAAVTVTPAAHPSAARTASTGVEHADRSRRATHRAREDDGVLLGAVHGVADGADGLFGGGRHDAKHRVRCGERSNVETLRRRYSR